MGSCIIEKSNNSITTKLCANLLNNREKIKIFLVHDTIQQLNCVMHYLNKKIALKLFDKFIVYSDEITCRKR